MNKSQFEQILEEGEGTLIEFKQSFSPSIAKEISAFANTAGAGSLSELMTATK